MAPCWEEWSEAADLQAVDAFGYDTDGIPSRRLDLEKRLDYLDGYCRSVNAALGQRPAEPRLSWWERGWLGRVLRWPGRG